MPPPNMQQPSQQQQHQTVNQAAQAQAAYYQQYMQMQYMYSSMAYAQQAQQQQAQQQKQQQKSAASSTTTIPSSKNASTAQTTYLQKNYGVSPNLKPNPPPPPPPPPSSSSSSNPDGTLKPQQQSQPIKFNLKFKQNQGAKTTGTEGPTGGPSRKSRFDTTPKSPAIAATTSPVPSLLNSMDNVGKQQSAFAAAKLRAEQLQKEKRLFQQTQQQQIDDADKIQSKKVKTYKDGDGDGEVDEKERKEKQDKAASDIVFDINKWPPALKAYCAKVYQHYQPLSSQVTEEQVTKYLQQRITDAFKTKPDLSIGWHCEPIPSVAAIRRFAPSRPITHNHPPPPQSYQQQRNNQSRQMGNSVSAAATEAAKKILHTPSAFNNKPSAFNNNPNRQKNAMDQLNSGKKDNTTWRNEMGKKRKIRSNRSSSSSRSGSRSRSRSSSSSSSSNSSSSSRSSFSSSSSENYIKLSSASKQKNGSFQSRLNNNNKNNIKFGTHKMQIDNKNNLTGNKKLTKKQKKLQAFQQRRQQLMFNNSSFDNERPPVEKKPVRMIYELIREHEQETNGYGNENGGGNGDIVCVGTCTDMEKEYFRLTGPPDPTTIRSLPSLRKSLKYVLNEYEKAPRTYRYIQEQLKSIRQDLTVQVIKNEFTIDVYETHARIAIKNKDRDEFNQCQSQLKVLYETVLAAAQKEMKEKKIQNPNFNLNKKKYRNNLAEFLGYRLLYNMLTKSFKDINQVIKEIKSEKFADNHYLKHLLELNRAWAMNNYVRFFQLYKKCNEMSKFMIDFFIQRERKQALKVIIKSYRPSIGLEKVTDFLAYDSLEECEAELLAFKLSIVKLEEPSSTSITSSASSPSLSTLKSPAKKKFQTLRKKFILTLDCKSCNVQNL